MNVTAPPRPSRRPQHGSDPEALIQEARDRQRRRRRRVGLFALAVCALVGAGAYALFGHATGEPAVGAAAPVRIAASPRCPGAGIGTVAFARAGALVTVDLRTCTETTLVRSGVTGGVQFSHDGRYVSFWGGYVPVTGGAVRRVYGQWSPKADALATVTKAGALDLVSVSGARRELLSAGWGVRSLAFSPGGRTLAVGRSTYRNYRQLPPYHQQIWTIDLATGARRLVFAEPRNALAPPDLTGYSPDGRWLLFTEDVQNSASIAADGLPLEALNVATGRVHRVAPAVLRNADFATWCGSSLVYVADNGGREVTLGDGIVAARPPLWRPQTILPARGSTSWNGVACSSTGRLAVAAGPSGADTPFGHEDRSIWLVAPRAGATPKRIGATVPPRGSTDELPQWSGDGRYLTFVRTKPGGTGGHGELFAYDTSTGRLIGPIANVGTASNYYGSYSWPRQLAWYR